MQYSQKKERAATGKLFFGTEKFSSPPSSGAAITRNNKKRETQGKVSLLEC